MFNFSSLLPSITSISEITLPELLPFAIPAAIVAPFITYALAKRGDAEKREIEYRTFIDVSEIEDDSSLTSHPRKPGTKVIMPENMPPLGEMEEEPQSHSLGYMNYPVQMFKFLKITPFGKSIITSGNISIKMIDLKTGNLVEYSITLPILDINEEIFITLFESTGRGNKFFLYDIEMNYRTQVGEEMIYKRNSELTKSQDTSYVDFHKVKKRFGNEEILGRNEGTNSKWRHL